MRFFKRLTLGLPRKVLIPAIIWSLASGFVVTIFQTLCSLVLLDESKSFYMRLALGLTAYVIIWNILYYFGDNMIEMSTTYIENNACRYYYDKLYKIRPEILKANSTGYISSLVTSAATAQGELFLTLTDSTIFRFGRLVAIFLTLCTFSARAASLYIGLFLIGIAVRVGIHLLVTRKYIVATAKAEGERGMIMVDVLSNINTVQKTQSIDFTLDKIDETLEDVLKWDWLWQLVDNGAYALMCVIHCMWLPIVIWTTSDYAELRSPGMVACVSIAAMVLVDAGGNIAKVLRRYSKFKSKVDLLENIISEDNIRKSLCHEPFIRLTVKDCVHSYMDSVSKSEVTVSIPEFDLRHGDIVCIQGESGQGKTTLLHLISNEIENDNVSINGYNVDKRLDCVFVAQDTEILNMSLRDNLLMGKQEDDGYLQYILHTVGLGGWFCNLPDGLDTMLGEHGVFVSTGQRQRINLLRGLLNDTADVYLFDEPTSNLDDETEARVIDLMKRLLKGKTVVIVTHKEAITEICNKFYVFENGVLHIK